MKNLLLIAAVLLMPLCSIPAIAEPANLTLVSFGDFSVTYGPGTDGAFDSEDGVRRMVRRMKARGFRGLVFRADRSMLPEAFITTFPAQQVRPETVYIDGVPKRIEHDFDVLRTLKDEAGADFQLWAYYPTIYSHGAPAVVVDHTTGKETRGWHYQHSYAVAHPEVMSVDRAGNRHYMIWEYAYPGARQAVIAEFVELARRYGIRRFAADLRSEATQVQPPPEHADQFGFNAPVVEEMKRRHDVDILTDPRFDWRSPSYDPHDAMVENWRKLRGGYLTQLYRELRAALDAVAPGIEVSVAVPGDRVGTPLGNWPVEWQTWIKEGLVNQIVAPAGLNAGQTESYAPGSAAAKRGYLDPSVPFANFKAFAVANPFQGKTASVLRTGAPSTMFHTMPPDADGWRSTFGFDAYCLSARQRWAQWERDFRDFGHINFIAQDFDTFAEGRKGHDGIGDLGYRPDLRRGPGFWYLAGMDTEKKPAFECPLVQSAVRRGDSGRALQLTRDANGGGLVARHMSSLNRAAWQQMLDSAVSSGVCEWEFWLRRADEKSTLGCYLSFNGGDTAGRFNKVGLQIGTGTDGSVKYLHDGKLTAPAQPAGVPVGKWRRVIFTLDMGRRTFSATLGGDTPDDAPQLICRDAPFPGTAAFNWMDFMPSGPLGSTTHLDDVALRWEPQMRTAPGPTVLLREGFEQQPLRAPLTAPWRILDAAPSDITVGNDISCGDEYRSLRFHNAGGRAQLLAGALTLPTSGTLLLDADVFPRGDNKQLNSFPDPKNKGTDEISLSLVQRDTGVTLIELRLKNGTWHYAAHNVPLADTKIPTEFDAWHHLQLALDTRTRVFRVNTQVIGSPPRVLFEKTLDSLPAAGTPLTLELACRRAKSRPDGAAFDNIHITSTALPAKEKLHVYLLFGQSNMAGRGKLKGVQPPPHPRVLRFTRDHTWAAADEPVHFDVPEICGAGIGTSFAQDMAEADAGVTIGLVPCAFSGAPLADYLRGGVRYEESITRARAAMQDGTLKGILWHQGETDSSDPALAKTYTERLSLAIAQWREALGMPDLSVVAGELCRDLPTVARDGKTPRHGAIVNAQINALPTQVPHTAVVSSEGLTHIGDKAHFDTQALREFGHRYAKAMRELQKGNP